MPFHLSPASLCHLQGVHPDLVKVVNRAIEITTIDFTVIEGLRTEDEEHKCIAAGKSETMHSRHLTGHAVDLGAIVNDVLSWDWPNYQKINDAMQQAASELRVPITWGGGWTTLKDGDHWELPRAQYPDTEVFT